VVIGLAWNWTARSFALVRVGEQLLVFRSDPITFATEDTAKHYKKDRPDNSAEQMTVHLRQRKGSAGLSLARLV
jgi:hypothetical protein